MSQTHSVSQESLAFSTISPLFMDQFGRSLQFCNIEFEMEAISDGCRSENARYVYIFFNSE